MIKIVITYQLKPGLIKETKNILVDKWKFKS